MKPSCPEGENQTIEICRCRNNLIGLSIIDILLTLSNVDDGDTVPTPVTTVLSLQNLMDANKFLVLFNVI